MVVGLDDPGVLRPVDQERIIRPEKPFGIRHMDMPATPGRVWEAMEGRAEPPQ